ncbi:MAG: MMPL family transporter, partial [Pseudolabrys sp.]
MPPSGRVPAEPPRAIKPRNLALGIERIGFFSLTHRTLCALVFIVLSIVAAVGFVRVKVDDSLSQLFRSDTAEFRTYEEVTHRFPSNEFDVLIVIEGDQLLARPSLEKLRELAINLQLIDGTRGLISIFSAREPPNNGQIPPPLFPNPLPQGAEYQALIERVMANEIIKDKMLSPDGKLTLMVLALEPDATGPGRLNKIVDEIRDEVKTQLAGTGLRGELSGVPVMQHEIRNAIQSDRLVYNSLGFVVGCLIAIMFFRRFSFMVIAAGPPLVAILLALGALGWFGFSLNMFLNVMTPLIMVISFSDSMQITFAARDRLLAGDDKATAFRNALLIVGPACVLTHATAGVSFIALQFSSSDLIRTFGEAGLVAVTVALVAVLMGVPLLGVLLIRNEAEFVAAVRNMDTALNALRRFCGWIAVQMVARPGLYSLISLLVVVVLSLGYAQLQARYRL